MALAFESMKFQQLQAKLEGSSNPADVFFENLPSPEEFRVATDFQAYCKVVLKVIWLIDAFNMIYHNWNDFGGTNDPQFDQLVKTVFGERSENRMLCFRAFEAALAGWALDRSRDCDKLPATTAKDKLISYYLWVIRGRKDEESPRDVVIHADGVSTASSHEFLPSSDLKKCMPCASCGKAGSTARCSGCSIVQDGRVVYGTFYCNRECMKAHWNKHKRVCKDVRGLRRSSATFTDLFLELTRFTPFGVTKSISEEDGMIVVVADYPYERILLGKTVLMKFPCELASSEEQALACRTVGWCQHVTGTAKKLFEDLIQRMELCLPPVFLNCVMSHPSNPQRALAACHLVEEVHFAPKNVHKPVRHIIPDGEHDFPIVSGHAAIRVTLPSGQRFALDPTGAQYGWREHLAPWDDYERHRVHMIDSVAAVAAPAAAAPAEMDAVYKPDGLWETEARRCMAVMARCLADRAAHHASRHLGFESLSALALCAPEEADFVHARRALAEEARRFLAGYAARVEAGWMQKWYCDGAFARPYSTRSEAAHDRLRGVWLTDAEVEASAGFRQQKAIWRERFDRFGDGLPGSDAGVSLGQECRVISSMLVCGLCEAEQEDQPEEGSGQAYDGPARG